MVYLRRLYAHPWSYHQRLFYQVLKCLLIGL